MIFCDEIELRALTIEENYGTLTYGDCIKYKARVEDTSRIIKNAGGKDIKSNYLVFLDKTVGVNKGDRITITKRFGKKITNTEYEVLEVFHAGGFVSHHIEVTI